MTAASDLQVDVSHEVALAVDVRTAAAMLGVGTRTVELLIASGQLASLHIGRCRRIRRVDLEDYLARRVAAEVELEHLHVEALPAEALHLVSSHRRGRVR